MVTKTDLHEMSVEQAKKVHSLIRAECCNYDGGNCEILDDGEYHKCPQHASRVLDCSWFIEAVLPLNPALEAEVRNTSKDNIKKCEMCGKSFIPKSNSARYCEKCAVKAHKIQQAAYARKRRSIVDK